MRAPLVPIRFADPVDLAICFVSGRPWFTVPNESFSGSVNALMILVH
jgi:hypothetical protein